jgi:ADP-ribose pyrophosphatase
LTPVTGGGAFRVVGASTVATTGFLSLDDLAVEAPDGTVHQRYVVRHPGAVVVVPVEDDHEHVLLVRQYRAAVDGDLLEVPAGKRDVDGEAPEATAHRELEEEIGHRARTLVPLAEFYNSPGFTDEYTYLYAAVGLVALDARNTQTAEEHEMQIERVALADVPAMIDAREIVDAKTIIGLTLARAQLEHAAP